MLLALAFEVKKVDNILFFCQKGINNVLTNSYVAQNVLSVDLVTPEKRGSPEIENGKMNIESSAY